MAYGNIICVVNRTTEDLSYMKDGYQHVLVPGKNHIPATHVRFAKQQNVFMGSEDYGNPTRFVSLVGIDGKDDCSLLDYAEAKRSVERINPKTLAPGRQTGRTQEAANVVVSRYGLGPMEGDGQIDSSFVRESGA